MRQMLTVLMLGNAALFVFGALQHAGGIVGPSGFTLPLLEEGQLLPKEEVLRSQGTAGMRREEASRTRSNTTKDNVRKQCATARKTDERDMNAQDCTLQNATGARFRLGRRFCEAHRLGHAAIPLSDESRVIG